ncbi:MAG: hypothetical protein AAGH79_02415 [Bacteroidota bacterium]
MKLNKLYFLAAIVSVVAFASCNDDEMMMEDPDPMLEIPSEYVSADFDANVTAENTVIDELSAMTSAANDAEANAQSVAVDAIEYPSTLSSVTLDSYEAQVKDWLVELVAAANSPDGFQTPAVGEAPAADQDGGLLGSRLLDENGLELEQMIQKGSFGAACYNHALTVINGDLSESSAIDKLVEIHGADIAFDVSNTTAAATYSRRRSDLTAQTGFFFDIKNNLITAKAAIEGGSDFDEERDQALADYLLNWEKSNFATVIYYANAAKTKIQDAASIQDQTEKDDALGSAMHSYAEGVAFAAGFRGISQKQITDAQIDGVLALLLTPEGETPESHRFLTEVALLANLDQVIDDIQAVYGFTDAEVNGFFVNNNP